MNVTIGTIKTITMTAEELRAELLKKQEALTFLRNVTAKRKNHLGQVRWTQGGIRMFNRLNAEIAELTHALGGA